MVEKTYEQEIMEFVENRAREICAKEEHEMVAFLCRLKNKSTKEARNEFVIMPMHMFPSKDIATKALRKSCELVGADFFVFVCEGWAASIPQDRAEEFLKKNIAPSELPRDDRDEIVMVNLVRHDGTSIVEVAKIIDRKDHREVKEWIRSEDQRSSGRFIFSWDNTKRQLPEPENMPEGKPGEVPVVKVAYMTGNSASGKGIDASKN